MLERRTAPRLHPGSVRARIRLGDRLAIVNLSAGGALVEGRRPLRPGGRIEVQLESDLRNGIVTARVLRCAVSAIEPENGVTYRAALAFGEPCEWVREAATPHG